MATKRKTPPKLGQHFLRDKKIIEDMLDAAYLTSRDTVLEIGPGEGLLTKELLHKAKKVVAVERDIDLADRMKNAGLGEHLLLFSDDIRNIVDTDQFKEELGKDYVLIANIPYYLSGWIFRTFLEDESLRPRQMVLLIQEEVARRAAPRRGAPKSLLSMVVSAFGKPHIVRIVRPGAFSPPPKVTSAVLAIDDISNVFFTGKNYTAQQFFSILRKAFQGKRKQLKRSLQNIFFHEGAKKNPALQALGMRRPETLTLDEWSLIARVAHETEK